MLNKSDIKIGDVLYAVPENEWDSPRISYVEHLDAGIWERGPFKGLFDLSVGSYERNMWDDKDSPDHSKKYDVKVPFDYIRELMHASEKFRRAYLKAVLPIADFSYDHYGQLPPSTICWKEEIKEGDCFFCYGHYSDMAVCRIEKMRHPDEYGIFARDREKNPDKEWPMQAQIIHKGRIDNSHAIFRSSLIRPVPEDMYMSALNAYEDYRKTFDEVVAGIRKEYNLPETKTQEKGGDQ